MEELLVKFREKLATEGLSWDGVCQKVGFSKGTVRDLVHNKRKFNFQTLHRVYCFVNDLPQIDWKKFGNCSCCLGILPRVEMKHWRCEQCHEMQSKKWHDSRSLEVRRIAEKLRRKNMTPEEKTRFLDRSLKNRYQQRYGDFWQEWILARCIDMEVHNKRKKLWENEKPLNVLQAKRRASQKRLLSLLVTSPENSGQL